MEEDVEWVQAVGRAEGKAKGAEDEAVWAAPLPPDLPASASARGAGIRSRMSAACPAPNVSARSVEAT
jgi:hypothetical protein